MAKENINRGSVSSSVQHIERCFCQNYSCEARPVKQEKINENDPNVYMISETERFRYIKNENGAICGGGKTSGCIENCRIDMDEQKIDYSNKIFKPRPVETPIQNETETKKIKTNNSKNHSKHPKHKNH